ncbi:universal stress protein [Nocardia sp. SYP-A9097]|uniref:universal stress protein n=1 Tax=Nocardia sp. SYP-A9097 TaxID=2663237 RepID=UPI00129AF6E2|nr:universal stress protein [Nocardia sp. SYP-A9097]MRH87608.1 universal stress protein [Nocardia sp. SYP-A9097]
MTEHSDSTTRQLNPPIVVAVDGSAISYQAAAWAAVDASLHGSPLRIVTSVAVPSGFGPGAVLTDSDLQWLFTDGERVVAEASRVARAGGAVEGVVITTEVTLEPIVSYLLAQSRDARMMVLGSRGLGALRQGLLGSVSTAVTRHAHCPVAVIQANAAADPVSVVKPVLVGVDGSPNSVPALELAFEEASFRKVGLTALHAWSDVGGIPLPGWDVVREQEDEEFAQRLAGFGERYPDVPVRRILVMDRPVRALLDESENAQLLVVGSHGRGGFTGMLLGSTSAAVLHSVDCPTIVVREG